MEPSSPPFSRFTGKNTKALYKNYYLLEDLKEGFSCCNPNHFLYIFDSWQINNVYIIVCILFNYRIKKMLKTFFFDFQDFHYHILPNMGTIKE